MFAIMCAKSINFYVFVGKDDALCSLNYVPSLGLQSAIFGTRLHASVAELCHLFMEYSKISGYGHAWIGYAISVSGNQVFLDEIRRFMKIKKIIIWKELFRKYECGT